MKGLTILQLIFILQFAPLTLSGQNQIVGKWLSPKRDAIVEIYELSGKFYGKIIWIKNTENNNYPVDSNNPETKLRTRPLIGSIVVRNLTYKENEWVEGSLYNPTTGKTYQCKLELPELNTLKITCFLGPFYTSRIWTRH